MHNQRTLVELDPASRTAEIIGAMVDFVPVQEDNGALIAQMADASIRIVSLTVIEGIHLSPLIAMRQAKKPLRATVVHFPT